MRSLVFDLIKQKVLMINLSIYIFTLWYTLEQSYPTSFSLYSLFAICIFPFISKPSLRVDNIFHLSKYSALSISFTVNQTDRNFTNIILLSLLLEFLIFLRPDHEESDTAGWWSDILISSKCLLSWHTKVYTLVLPLRL